MLHTEILTDKQVGMGEWVQGFGTNFYLVGGTALALQLGHRRSIDFDLFTIDSFDNDRILARVKRHTGIVQTHVKQTDQLTIVTSDDVKMTWYRYPYAIPQETMWGGLPMPDTLTIAAMKAFAIGQRAKWKDYVDMYVLLSKFGLSKIVEKTNELFGDGLFDEALLRGQLAYHKDIDYHEEVEWMPGYEVSREEILKSLIEVAVS